MTDADAVAFVALTTERLTLRPYAPDDAAPLHRLINDWEVCRNLAVVPFPYPRPFADEWIASARADLAAGRAYELAIVGHEGEQETIVGGVSLRLDGPPGEAVLGYWVGRRFWGHGVAGEAASRLARWGLANLDVERITATVISDNPASAAVLRHVGLRHTGEGTKAYVARGGEHQVLCFQATRADLFGHPETDTPSHATATPGHAAAEGALPLLLVAACALIDTDGRVLLARRPEGKKMAGLWEFPGGKLNPGETPEAALIRELKEELGIDVATTCLAPFAFASHPYDRFHLLMPLYLCRRWRGTIQPLEGQTLTWVRPQRLGDYPMPEADKPLVPLLREFL